MLKVAFHIQIPNSIYSISSVKTGKKGLPNIAANKCKTSLWPQTPQTTCCEYLFTTSTRHKWLIFIILRMLINQCKRGEKAGNI